MSDEPEIFSGSGKGFPIDRYSDQFFVTCYNAQGEIDWLLKSGQWCDHGRLLGVTSLADGTVVVAFRTSYMQQYVTVIQDDGTTQSVGFDRSGNSGQNDVGQYDFFVEVNPRGDFIRFCGVKGLIKDDWISFNSTPDSGYIITQVDHEKVSNGSGGTKDVAHNYIQKVTKEHRLEWTYKLKYLDKSCCSYFEDASLSAVGTDGDVYIAGSFREGVLPDGLKPHTAPLLDKVTQYNQPFESYVARLSASGKLRWIRYSEGKSLIHSITVNDNQLVIGGNITLQKNLYGMKIDTTSAKKAYIATFDLAGKPRWVQTFNAINIPAVSQDWDGNIYAAFRNQRSRGVPPLIIGTDSIPDAYERVIVACFDAQGKYRWNKMSRAMISINAHSHIHNDACGNLYYTSEMWYSLPVNMSLFDGAIVRGKGYGGAPLAARIRTTIPDELLAINMKLSQSVAIEPRNKKGRIEKKPVNQPPTLVKDTAQVVHMPSAVNPDAVHSGRCVPIPFPWRLVLFPNPTTGVFTARATISYSDNQVGLELWDVKGAFIRQLSPIQLRETGSFDMSCDISELASGLYIVVLKGSGAAVSDRLVKQ